MPNKSPLSRVKDEFGGKDKLVDKIVGLISSTADEPKDDLRKRLLGAANKKLIKLHRVASTVKEKHGTQEKLVDATAGLLGRGKDKDYLQRLGSFSAARLLDMARAAERRTGAKTAAPKAKPAATAAEPSPKKG